MPNHSNHRLLLAATLGSALTAAAFLILGFGPLSPPSGSVTSTAKPLSEVEPRTAVNAANTPGDADSLYKITQPGSYYLTGNITGVAGKHGIEIAASGVTLDLNGFDLAGVSGMGAFDGVTATASVFNTTIRNGSVREWGGDGIDLGAFSASNSLIHGVTATSNAGVGILTGNHCSLTRCTATSNAGSGISAGTTCTIVACVARGNSSNGIALNTFGVVKDCTSTANVAVGIAALNSGCVISGCNVSGNLSTGITINSAAVITDCSVLGNNGSGISGSTASTISGCTVRANGFDGIVAGSGCLVMNNTCLGNGTAGIGAGVHATGNDNRIEGNNCTTCDIGVDVDVAGNYIVRNTCSGNTTDWDIVANNVFGPIVDRRAPGSAAVTGFTAASSLGSTEPNANFSY